MDPVCLITLIPFLDEKLIPGNGLNRKFLVKLPDEGPGRSFAGFHFSSGKFPFQGITHSPAALADEDGGVPDENPDRHFLHAG